VSGLVADPEPPPLGTRLDQRRLGSLFATLLVGVAGLLVIENASALV
jgi:hypothetical protein